MTQLCASAAPFHALPTLEACNDCTVHNWPKKEFRIPGLSLNPSTLRSQRPYLPRTPHLARAASAAAARTSPRTRAPARPGARPAAGSAGRSPASPARWPAGAAPARRPRGCAPVRSPAACEQPRINPMRSSASHCHNCLNFSCNSALSACLASAATPAHLTGSQHHSHATRSPRPKYKFSHCLSQAFILLELLDSLRLEQLGDLSSRTGHCHTPSPRQQTATGEATQGRLLACGRAGRLATALPPVPLLGSAAVIAAEFVPATAGSAYRLDPSVATTTSSPLPPAEAPVFK